MQPHGLQKYEYAEASIPETERAVANERTVSGLKWMAKRTCTATTSLAMEFLPYWCFQSSAAPNSLVTAFADAQLSNLKCLTFSENYQPGGALEGFLDWLLERAPRLEVMKLDVTTRHLPAGQITFQHMRHLRCVATILILNFWLLSSSPAWKPCQYIIPCMTLRGRRSTCQDARSSSIWRCLDILRKSCYGTPQAQASAL